MTGLYSAPVAGTVPTLTPGSVAFANASGVLTQDNANLRYASGLLSIHAGDLLGLFAPQVVDVRHGTAAAPVTTSGPTFKVSRVETISRATVEATGNIGTDGYNQVAAIAGYSSALITSDVQPVGVLAYATSASTSVASGPGHDACGLYAVGTHTGTGIGIGAFFNGGRADNSSKAGAIQFNVNNAGGDNAYNPAGLSQVAGLWGTVSGAGDAGAGFTLGNAFGFQWDAGIVFTSQVAGGKTGAIKTVGIADHSNALTSYLVSGSHNYGIDLPGTFANSAIRAGAAPGTSFVDILAPASAVGMTVRGSGGNIAVFRNNGGASAMFVNEAGTTFNNNLGFTNTGTVGESMLVKYSEELLTLGTGAATTDTTGNLLPANSLILGVLVRVTTAITTATSFSVGDATTAARFASGVAVAAGTTANGINQANGGVAAGAGMMQTAAAKVRITSNTTPGAGVVRVTVAYMQFTAPTS